jgi:hypothetical protein
MKMKLLAITVCLLIPTGRVIATTPGDCTKMASPDDRLACFDKLFPANTRAADPKKELRDITVDENARLDKTLKIFGTARRSETARSM